MRRRLIGGGRPTSTRNGRRSIELARRRRFFGRQWGIHAQHKPAEAALDNEAVAGALAVLAGGLRRQHPQACPCEWQESNRQPAAVTVTAPADAAVAATGGGRSAAAAAERCTQQRVLVAVA